MTTQQQVLDLLSPIAAALETERYTHIKTDNPAKLQRQLSRLTRRRGNWSWKFSHGDGGLYISLHKDHTGQAGFLRSCPEPNK